MARKGTAGDTAPKLPKAITFHEDDRCVELRLRVKKGETPRVVILDEPSMIELQQIEGIVKRVDDALPDVPDVPNGEVDDATKKAILEDREKAIQEQQVFLRGDPDSEKLPPYGQAFLDVLHVLLPDDEEVKAEELPAGVQHINTVARLLAFYRGPLPGLAVT